MTWEARALAAEAEVERLRGINRELVRDHNALLGALARERTTPNAAADAIQVVQGALANAERELDSALGIVRLDIEEVESRGRIVVASEADRP